MTDIGPHLLGRVPSEPDSRDYRMADVLASDSSDLDGALAALLKSHTSKATKAWAQVATDAIKKLQPANPVPTPAPTPTPSPAVTGNPWNDTKQLDQGNTGHCVGFGWAQWGNTDPVNDNFTDDDGHRVYYECKIIDGEPSQENGSSVRSGAKAMKARGRIGAYVFATSMADIKAWVTNKGPVVIGTDWTSNMFHPDINGIVHPTGGIAGGHCYLLIEWRADDLLTFQNSWGSDFGDNGYFRMHATEFQGLIDAQGEACAGLELPLL